MKTLSLANINFREIPVRLDPRNKNVDAASLSAIISALMMVMFHIPFFRYACANVSGTFSGAMIILSLAVILFTINHLVFFLLLRFCGKVGKGIISFFFLGNSIGLYGINKFKALITDQMMVNVFNTRISEASGFFSFSLVLYILLLGLLPSVLLFMVKVKKNSWKTGLANICSSVVIILTVIGLNYKNTLWIDRHSTIIGSLILPWSYIVNSARAATKYYDDYMWKEHAEKLPAITVKDSTRCAVVLVIGESARTANFQLFGYGRATNPLLCRDKDSLGIKMYPAISAGVSTIDGVKAILSHENTGSSRVEILPNYLYRHGVDVLWQTSNWGEKPLCIEHFRSASDIAESTGGNPDYDEILLDGVTDFITESKGAKVLVVLHTSTSHGPLYNEKYPSEFEVFTPVCNTVEVADCPQQDLVNSYDNSIVYTDYLLHTLIGQLSKIEGWKVSMIYVSDHGESLGEPHGSFGKIYMHGSIPYDMAPDEQTHIPFIVWSNVQNQQYKDTSTLEQYSAFHSTMGFLGLDSPIYNKEADIFQK